MSEEGEVVGDDGRHAAGSGDLTAAGECVSALCFDLWIEAWRQKVASGEMVFVRYADDLVVGFPAA